MKNTCWLFVISILYPAVILAGQPDRTELLGNPRFVEAAAEPSFVQLAPEELPNRVQVIPSRDFAVFGFNNPKVQLHLPRCDNSAYAAVEFSPARLLDSQGREVQYERERGIYDHDTHSDELRFAPLEGGTPVEFSRAEGTIVLRYPVRMKTVSMKAGSPAPAGLKLRIDGPFVSWTGKEPPLPEAASFTPFEQWRAFDASGRRLEKHPHESFSMNKGVTTETYAYWGEVSEVRVDVVEEWAEVEIVYSLPPIDPLPDDRIGMAPESDRVTAPPAGKVTIQVVAPKSRPAEGGAGQMSPEDALAQLRKLGFRRFDAESFVLAATQGNSQALRLFIAGGMPADIEAGGRTALMSAAMMGRVEAGKLLLAAGADVNKPDVTGSPPLLRLVMRCDATELLQAFIDAGAELNAELPGGVTALEMARLANCAENARILQAAGAR